MALGDPLFSAWAEPSVGKRPDAQNIDRLLRLAECEPTVNVVWLQGHHGAIDSLIGALARRDILAVDGPEGPVRAAVLNAALAVAIEYYARQAKGGGSIDDLVPRAVRLALG